ncbi:MAG: carbohydrate ABC transporter permease [Planctomycetota bacterium]
MTNAPVQAEAAALPALGNEPRRKPKDPATYLTYALLIFGALLLLVPFYWMLTNSLKTEADASKIPPSLLPEQLLWSNYPDALAKMDFLNALANTTVITTLSVLGQVISSSLVGFGFARFRFRGRNFLFLLMLSTMMLPPQVSMIPLFIGFRNLGMIDTIWPLVLPMWLGTPFYVFMFRQFFSQVPEELVEAARIDGASNLMIYSRLMLPLSTPVIAIVAIYTFMFTWNDFLGPLIYLNTPEMRTLALALNAFSGQYGVSDVQLLMAASFVTMLPCILLFFAAQRYFVDTGASSGLKG